MQKFYLILISLFILGFLIRFFPFRTDSDFHFWDETVYLQHAEILSGYREDNYNEFDFRPPLLPVIIALFYKLKHSVVIAHTIVAFVASLGILSTFFLAKTMFENKKTALISAAIFLLNPLHISLSHTILTEPLLPTFWCLTVLFMVLAIKKKSLVFYFLSGIFLGLSILLKFTSLQLVFYIVLTFLLIPKIKKNFLHEMKRLFLVFFATFLVLLPYLIFSQIRFGFFLYTFFQQYRVVSWGVPTPWHIFYTQFFELFPPIFSLGIFIYILEKIKDKKISEKEVLLLIYIIIPFILLQTLISKEIRYLLPILPFLSISSAIGFSQLDLRNKNIFIPSILLILIFFILSISYIKEIKGYLDWLKEKPAIMVAALWLRESTPKDSIVYNNFQCVPLAYYSTRKIYVLPFARNFQDDLEKFMPEDGYLVYSSNSPKDKEPKLDFLMSDERFELIKIFNDSREEVYIFHYSK
jgi:4-amino-4-deoxy-L-arabinose transferase-like glycosyltransferase